MLINIVKLDVELKAAGIPIYGCASDGRIDFLPSATPAQLQQAAAILAAHDPRDYDKEKQDAALGEFKTLTVLAGKSDAQIQEWVNANVNDLMSAKAAITLLARAVGALARDRGVV